MDPERYGLTNPEAYREFITNWREAVGHSYMGGDPDEIALPITKRVMDGDGGLLIALDMLQRIMTSGDTETAYAAAGDIGITLLSQPVSEAEGGRYMIEEEP